MRDSTSVPPIARLQENCLPIVSGQGPIQVVGHLLDTWVPQLPVCCCFAADTLADCLQQSSRSLSRWEIWQAGLLSLRLGVLASKGSVTWAREAGAMRTLLPEKDVSVRRWLAAQGAKEPWIKADMVPAVRPSGPRAG